MARAGRDAFCRKNTAERKWARAARLRATLDSVSIFSFSAGSSPAGGLEFDVRLDNNIHGAYKMATRRSLFVAEAAKVAPNACSANRAHLSRCAFSFGSACPDFGLLLSGISIIFLLFIDRQIELPAVQYKHPLA